MKRCGSRTAILFCFATLQLLNAGRGAEPPPRAALGLEHLLPADGAHVDVMEPTFPARFAPLAAKFRESIRNHFDWFMSHRKAAREGEPLPYDPRLGLTQEEYREFLKLGEEATLRKIRAVPLRVVKRDERFHFDGGPELQELTALELDVSGEFVVTPFGIAKERRTIEATEKQKLTGPWTGPGWKLEKGDEDAATGTVVRFSLGRLKESGRGIMYYDVKHFDGISRKRISLILFYDLKRE